MADTKDDPGTNAASAVDDAGEQEQELPRGYSRGATEAVHLPNPRSFANQSEYERALRDADAANWQTEAVNARGGV